MDNGKPARVVGALYNIHRMKSELSENSERLYMNQSALQAINGVYVSIFYVNLEEDTYYAVRLPEAGSVMAPPRNGSYSGQLRSYILREINLADWNKVSDICRKENLLRELKTENRHMEVEIPEQTVRAVAAYGSASQKGGERKTRYCNHRVS